MIPGLIITSVLTAFSNRVSALCSLPASVSLQQDKKLFCKKQKECSSPFKIQFASERFAGCAGFRRSELEAYNRIYGEAVDPAINSIWISHGPAASTVRQFMLEGK
jgi:hypothetical protein